MASYLVLVLVLVLGFVLVDVLVLWLVLRARRSSGPWGSSPWSPPGRPPP